MYVLKTLLIAVLFGAAAAGAVALIEWLVFEPPPVHVDDPMAPLHKKPSREWATPRA